MSNKLDQIKNKIRSSGGSSVHASLIDTDIIENDRKANAVALGNVTENVNVSGGDSGSVASVASAQVHPLVQERPNRKKKF